MASEEVSIFTAMSYSTETILYSEMWLNIFQYLVEVLFSVVMC